MFYWLFTEGRSLLQGLLAPLICLALMLPLILSALLGAGIQRTSLAKPFGDWSSIGRLLTHSMVSLAVLALLLLVMGASALQPARGRQTSNALIRFLSGGPDRIQHTRLVLFGSLMLFAVGALCGWDDQPASP